MTKAEQLLEQYSAMNESEVYRFRHTNGTHSFIKHGDTISFHNANKTGLEHGEAFATEMVGGHLHGELHIKVKDKANNIHNVHPHRVTHIGGHALEDVENY